MHILTHPGLTHFAATYGSGAFGDCPYSNSGTSTTCVVSSGNSALVNTGIAVGAVVGLACMILVITILVRFWRRPAERATETVVTEDERRDDESDQQPPLS